MFLYAGLFAAVAFASPADRVAQYAMAELSPVAIESAAPALKIQALTRRSDI